MSGYQPCDGSGRNATGLVRYGSQSNGLGMTRAKTFGECPSCGRTVMSNGLVMSIKVTRHKAQEQEITS
jgi:hypothetical protein